MEEGPPYREIALLCIIILAFGVWFAAVLGVPYGYWTHWPDDLQWLARLLTRRRVGTFIATVIVFIGWLIIRKREK